jgi:hypothetical protein
MYPTHHSRNREAQTADPNRRRSHDDASPGSADLVPRRRQLEKTVSWTGGERLRCLWYRLRLELADLNYASKRLVELQVP